MKKLKDIFVKMFNRIKNVFRAPTCIYGPPPQCYYGPPPKDLYGPLEPEEVEPDYSEKILSNKNEDDSEKNKE